MRVIWFKERPLQVLVGHGYYIIHYVVIVGAWKPPEHREQFKTSLQIWGRVVYNKAYQSASEFNTGPKYRIAVQRTCTIPNTNA